MIHIPLLHPYNTNKLKDFRFFVDKRDGAKITVTKLQTQMAIGSMDANLRETVTIIEPGEYLVITQLNILGVITEKDLFDNFTERKGGANGK